MRRIPFPLCLALALSCASTRARADTEGGAEIDLVSRFVWRGKAPSRGAALQPSMWISAHDVTASIWSNVALSDEAAGRRVTAYVPSIFFERAFDAWTFSTGVLVESGVGAPGTPPTSEAALDVSYGSDHARIASENRIDFGEARGAYFGDVALSIEGDAFDGSIRVRAAAAWATAAFNRVWFGVDQDALDLATLDLAFHRPLVGPLYLEAHAQLGTVLPPARSHVDEATLFVTGLAVGVEP